MNEEIAARWLETVRDPLAQWMDIPEHANGMDLEMALLVHTIYESEDARG